MKTTLRIEGMHCAGCAGSVERALKRIEGVRAVEVDRERKRAVVEHGQTIEPGALVALVNDIGFAAIIVAGGR